MMSGRNLKRLAQRAGQSSVWGCITVLLRRWCLAALFIMSASGTAGALELVVPAYFYPGAYWTDLNTAAGQAPVTAIMNPGNGPGAVSDPAYVAAVNSLRAAGGRVLGYVYSSYAVNNDSGNPAINTLAEVLADIDRYAQWYAIDGIFVDEMTNDNSPAHLGFYQQIYNYAKGKNPHWEVMGNPGTTTVEAYLAQGAADRLMVFENPSANYPGSTPDSWSNLYDRDHFVNLLYDEPSQTTMLSRLDLVQGRPVGGVYVTGDNLPNPWDTLPGYWQAEANRVAQINASFSPADFNQDGNVLAQDLDIWQRHYGETVGIFRHKGDATGDGVVDGADFLNWQLLDGTQIMATAVPEPSGFCLAGILAGCAQHLFRKCRLAMLHP